MATDPIRDDAAEPASIFQSNLPLSEKLDKARTELLDLSARNRLLNMPRAAKGAKAIEIIDEMSAEIFRLLVREIKPFTFLAGRAAGATELNDKDGEEADEIADLAQPDDDLVDDRGIHARHSDTRLQTRLTPKGLQKRLLELYFDARTLEEEQGVNILFLTLGALKWIDPQNAANIRYAPLVLIPVSLERGNAGEKFKLRVRQEEFASNLSLEAFLDRVHGIELPAFEATDAFDPIPYFTEISDAVSAKPGWEVVTDHITLGFFSFAKFLMYRDLDPETWPANGPITERRLVRGLLSEGFDANEDMIPEDSNIDPFIPPAEMLHIVDSDSSQTLAVHEVRRGRDMVIQGPPGTGKSQTIANIIAAAIADGKTVLFVAEKMAALEVVKRRLDANGVGDACLELHSNKANKRALLEELRRTWELGAPRPQDSGSLFTRLTEARDRLNAHCSRMHFAHGVSGLTPYQVIGQLSRLRLDGERPNDIDLDDPESWSSDMFALRHDVVSELVDRIGVVGRPDNHVWRGVGLSSVLPNDVERLTVRIAATASSLAEYDQRQTDLAVLLETPRPANLRALVKLIDLADRVAGSPSLSSIAMANPIWGNGAAPVASLLETGERYAALRSELGSVVYEEAWSTDLSEVVSALALLPADFPLEGFERLASLSADLPSLLTETGALARVLDRAAPTTLAGCDLLARLGHCVAVAPEASSAAFAADGWDTDIERASDVASAVAQLETAREKISGGLTDSAWGMDLAEPRAVLAAHGNGFFKIFSGEWRQKNRLVRSVLTRPDAPLEETLGILDALGRGQVALRSIEQDADFARTVFDSLWRGERSVSAPLVALVEWMRSLKGLGAEPRMIASRFPKRSEVLERSSRTKDLVDRITPVMRDVERDLSAVHSLAFGETLEVSEADLASLLAAVFRFHEADRGSRAAIVDIPAELDARRRLLDVLVAGQNAASAIAEGEPIGRAALAESWKGDRTDWARFRDAAKWIDENGDIRVLVSRIEDRKAPALIAGAIAKQRDVLVAELISLFDHLRLDRLAALGASEPDSLDITKLEVHLLAWSTAGEQLFQWVAYRDRAETGVEVGCGDVVARLADGRLAPDGALSAFEMAYYEAVFADQVELSPELGTFDGTLHGRLARDFADMDHQRIKSASFEVVSAHHKRVPARDGGSIGPLGTLRAEIARRRGHMPIRKLMEKAAPAIQALKPVFMMSPLSVAQFLAPGMFEFDLLVMDEASQIQPVDALGAVARAKQVVVVGDPKQLPPTAFFTKMTSGSSDDDEDGGGRVGDIESILGLFSARGLPTRMLRWHYRSKHESLIAVSNRQFYENKLFIVPSPYTQEAGMGLRFHHVPQGIFDAGATRTNLAEAKIVAQAIVAHARDAANLSLGVVAFSVAQRRAILDQLELLRRNLAPEVETFFQSNPAEPFFVKNLENVQGDERDVILISVGYGPNVPGGRVPMRFGPLGKEGGERRLNVLISRAKQRCEVFASMTDEDIEPDFAATRKGVLAFKMFMHFARTGRMTMAESTGQDHESVFEEQIAKALQARGYQVHRQVGLAGFFIDLAVADADRPGRYLLGIECDGVSYHDARSARDRDRLRQSVLESHGWSIHRVWSTDWFQRPNEQLELIIARIESAKTDHDAQTANQRAHRAVPIDIAVVEREDVSELSLVAVAEPQESPLYVEAVIARPTHLLSELHDTPRGALSSLAEKVVDIEGPVHVDEIVNRLRDAWDLKRAGGRIQDAVEKAVEVSVRTGRLVEENGFFSIPGRPVNVRDRSQVRSLSLKRLDTLPPAEIEVAIISVVRANLGATDEQVCVAVSRAIGFKATSSQLRDIIADGVTKAIELEKLARKNGILILGLEAPAPITAEVAPAPLSSLISQGEHEGLEFKETLRWDIAQAQVSKKLEEVVVKTLAGFANRVGGTLLVGVADNGEVPGMARDYASLGSSGGRDKLEIHLTNLLITHFGQASRASRIRVSFPDHGGRDVCRIDIDRSPKPVFVKLGDRNGNIGERFFVRSGNSTQELSVSEATNYIREHQSG